MANLRSINVISRITGLPLAGLVGTALAWSASGVVRTPPAVVDVGGGEYQVQPTDDDETVGTVVLVDLGVDALPRYTVLDVFKGDNSNQFFAVVVTNPDGTLWSGPAPSVSRYQWGAVDKLASAPARVSITSAVHVWSPSIADIANDASIRVDGPAGSAQPYWDGDVLPLVELPALPTSSLGEAIFSALTGYPALSALIGTRAYPNWLPQEETLPALVYTVISNVPASSMTTTVADMLKNARVQVDAYAKTYKDVQLVAAGVQAALDLSEPSPALSAELLNARDLFDDETQLHRVTMDFTVWR